MRDADQVWLESERGEWFRLADVLHFTVDHEAGGIASRAVAIMAYRVGNVDGTRNDDPVRFVLHTAQTDEAATNWIREHLMDSLVSVFVQP
jgi:hypothetical protein